MKRRFMYDSSSCDHCGETICNEEEDISNQQFDHLCHSCHSTVYRLCSVCDAYIIEEDDDEEEECRAVLHCSCIYCADKVEQYAFKCIGCDESVNKPRDDLTFPIHDVCYHCLKTRCLGCFKRDHTIVCKDCITSQPDFTLVLKMVGITDLAILIFEFIMPNSREIILSYETGTVHGCNLLADARRLHSEY